MISSEDLLALKRDLTLDEGVRLLPYKDSKGILTLGVGHNLVKPISMRAAQVILEDDIADTLIDLDRYVPWWQQLDHVRQRALINMCFQMGIGSAHDHTGLLAFERLLAALRTGDWTGAYRETLDSQYAREVPTRAKRIATAFLNGDTNVS